MKLGKMNGRTAGWLDVIARQTNGKLATQRNLEQIKKKIEFDPFKLRGKKGEERKR
jgi:hypothetical protein